MLRSRLTDIGIYVPGEENSKRALEEAFNFWAPVFEWEELATDVEEKRVRRSQVADLCRNLVWMWKEEEAVGIRLKGSYYYKDRKKDEKNQNNAKRFWAQLCKTADSWVSVRVFLSERHKYPVAGYRWWNMPKTKEAEQTPITETPDLEL